VLPASISLHAALLLNIHHCSKGLALPRAAASSSSWLQRGVIVIRMPCRTGQASCCCAALQLHIAYQAQHVPCSAVAHGCQARSAGSSAWRRRVDAAARTAHSAQEAAQSCSVYANRASEQPRYFHYGHEEGHGHGDWNHDQSTGEHTACRQLHGGGDGRHMCCLAGARVVVLAAALRCSYLKNCYDGV
jgi:hypothetical protein